MNHPATATLLSPTRGPKDDDDQCHQRQSNHQTQPQAAHMSGATPRTRPGMTPRKPSFTRPTNRRTSSRTALPCSPIPTIFTIDSATGSADVELDMIHLVTDPKSIDTSCSSLSPPEGSLSSFVSPIPSTPVVSTRHVSSRVSELRREMSHTRGWTNQGFETNNSNNNNNNSNNDDPMNGSSCSLTSPTTIMSSRVGILSSKARTRTSTTATIPPSATTFGLKSPQPKGTIETTTAMTSPSGAADHSHTGWRRIPSNHKKHTGSTTSRGADLQRVDDSAGVGIDDHHGSPVWRRIPPQRKSHTSSLVPDAHGVENCGGTEQDCSTVWRRIPIKTTKKRPSSSGWVPAESQGSDDCGTTTSATSTTATPPLCAAFKRGGSMRNMLRHKRRSEKESQKGDTSQPYVPHNRIHPPSSSIVNQQATSTDGIAPKTTSIVKRDSSSTEKRRVDLERFLANKEAVAHRGTAEQHQENKRGSREDDESMISLASDEQQDSNISHRSVLVVLPEQKLSQCIALPVYEDTEMCVEDSELLQQAHGVCIQDGSGSSGVYSGSVIQSSQVPHGYGKLAYQDGRTFDGSFVRGVKLYGTMHYLDGSTYQGQFLEGVRHGHGSYSFRGGVVYRGDFDNDMMHGPGTLTWPNVSRYVGYWKKGVRHGPGKYFRPDGTLHREGVWKKGALIAP